MKADGYECMVVIITVFAKRKFILLSALSAKAHTTLRKM